MQNVPVQNDIKEQFKTNQFPKFFSDLNWRFHYNFDIRDSFHSLKKNSLSLTFHEYFGHLTSNG